MASELQTINAVSEIAKRYLLTTLESQIEACRTLVSSGKLIDIGVFGRFKAGKSSFLNSLVGKSILPVGVTPVTAVITRLRYGPVEHVTVLYLDQSSKTVSPQELSAFVSSRSLE